ncbi:MAG: FUSC family protein [Oscillospiraceae bacterium]|nr:FUSC family protein [Oscillospiraceae bacterium]
MSKLEVGRALGSRKLPHLGQRILKTTAAVFLCLMIYYLRGFSGADMPTESAITAIICMQPYVRDSRTYAVNRMAGTLIGTFWGLIFLALLLIFPRLGHSPLLLYALMSLGILASLYSAVLVGKSVSAGQAAIVFLCIVISFPDISDPLRLTLRRILDVFIGTAVAIFINVFRLPREKKRNRLFFVRTRDLVPDRYAQIPSAALFRMNYLYDDGAKICLMSEHAPAFFTQQMSAAKVNVPLIVMDGAAIYDIHENRYLDAQTIPKEDSLELRQRLAELGIGYFIYTIRSNKTCIFHRGRLVIEEKLILDRLKRSPYRSYLDGENYDLDEVVYYKIIGKPKDLEQLEFQLRKALPKAKLRAVIRPQSGTPGISGLYIYAHSATMEQAEKRLLHRLSTEAEPLEPVEIVMRSPYRSERDAMHLLTLLENAYEPVSLFGRN